MKKSSSPYFSERSRTISETESQPPRPPTRTNKKTKVVATRKALKSGNKLLHNQHHGGAHHLNRSLSESNIVGNLRYGRHSRDNLLDEDSLDDAAALMHHGGHSAKRPPLKRSKSVDSSDHLRRSSGSDSRSCSSPAPSSGLECAQMIHLDQDTMSEAGSLVSDMFANESSTGGHIHLDRYSLISSTASNNNSTPRSVMSGGSVKGWLPDVAVVLWRRMLGSLGNINNIGRTSEKNVNSHYMNLHCHSLFCRGRHDSCADLQIPH